MTDFDPNSNRNSGLQPLGSPKDLDTLFGSNNARGATVRLPVGAMSSESLTNVQRNLGVELNCDGNVKLSISSGRGVIAEIDIADQPIKIIDNS